MCKRIIVVFLGKNLLFNAVYCNFIYFTPGKRNTKGSQSQDGNRTNNYSNTKNSLASLKNSKGTQSAPVLGSRSSSTGVSLLDRQGIQDIYAMFPLESNKLKASTSNSSTTDSEIAEVDESMRWENVESDPDEEAERIRVYKMHRRKRYLIEAYQKRDDKEEVMKLAKEIASCTNEDW